MAGFKRAKAEQAESKFRPYKHGLWKTPTYRSWISMIQRCTNSRATGYKYYGARGISVCPRWKDFRNFLDDMGIRPNGCTLDRCDSNGNYSPDNCRWSTKTRQQRNRRDQNAFSLNGETLTLQEWSERTGISYDALRNRYRKHWSAEIALSLPVSKSNSVLRKSRIQFRNVYGQFEKGVNHVGL